MGKSPYGSGALLTLDDVLGRTASSKGSIAQSGADSSASSAVRRSRRHYERQALIDSSHFDSIILNYSILNQSAWLDGPTLNPLFTYGRVGARAAQRGMGTVALRILEAGPWRRASIAPARDEPRRTDYATISNKRRRCAFSVMRAIRHSFPQRFASGSQPRRVDRAGRHLRGQSRRRRADAAERGPLSPEQLRRIEKLRANGFV